MMCFKDGSIMNEKECEFYYEFEYQFSESKDGFPITDVQKKHLFDCVVDKVNDEYRNGNINYTITMDDWYSFEKVYNDFK